MKKWNYIGAALLTLACLSARAQETDNISNRYGPPYYSGGSVQSPSETFAAYHASAAVASNGGVLRESAFIGSITPNPARTSAALMLETGTTEPVTIYVVNMNGNIVKSYTYGAGNSSYGIDVGNLPAGLYSIQLQERGKSLQSIELVKQE